MYTKCHRSRRAMNRGVPLLPVIFAPQGENNRQAVKIRGMPTWPGDLAAILFDVLPRDRADVVVAQPLLADAIDPHD
jgi:hypothetical protein